MSEMDGAFYRRELAQRNPAVTPQTHFRSSQKLHLFVFCLDEGAVGAVIDQDVTVFSPLYARMKSRGAFASNAQVYCVRRPEQNLILIAEQPLPIVPVQDELGSFARIHVATCLNLKR